MVATTAASTGASLDDPRHAGVQRLVGDLNAIQAHHPALFESDGDPAGFAWLAVDDAADNVLAFERRLPGTDEVIVCLANLKGLHAEDYRIGLARPGRWRGLVTTDDARYGGSGSWVPHLEAEPTAVAGPQPSPPCSPSRPSPSSTSSPTDDR